MTGRVDSAGWPADAGTVGTRTLSKLHCTNQVLCFPGIRVYLPVAMLLTLGSFIFGFLAGLAAVVAVQLVALSFLARTLSSPVALPPEGLPTGEAPSGQPDPDLYKRTVLDSVRGCAFCRSVRRFLLRRNNPTLPRP